MPLLVLFLMAYVIERAIRRAWGEATGRIKAGWKSAVDRYHEAVEPGKQKTTKGRRAATAARGLEKLGGWLVRAIGSILVACAGIAGALWYGGKEGAQAGAAKYKQYQEKKGADPHPWANAKPFSRLCPVCDDPLYPGGKGQAPWVHADGSTCTAAASKSDPEPEPEPETEPAKEESATPDDDGKPLDKPLDIPSEDGSPEPDATTTTTEGDMGDEDTSGGAEITHEQVKALVSDTTDAVGSLEASMDATNAALESVGMDADTKAAVAAAYEALGHARAAVEAIDAALIAGGHDDMAEIAAGREMADQGYYGAERG